ncbi:unnamed protein product, partial [Mycena citricolor]
SILPRVILYPDVWKRSSIATALVIWGQDKNPLGLHRRNRGLNISLFSALGFHGPEESLPKRLGPRRMIHTSG